MAMRQHDDFSDVLRLRRARAASRLALVVVLAPAGLGFLVALAWSLASAWL